VLLAVECALLPALPSGPTDALAETPGSCVVSGSEAFTPGLSPTPTDQAVSVTLTGTTCETLAGANSASISLSGTFLASCAGGVGSLAGQVLYASNPPAGTAVTAVDVSIGTIMLLAVTGTQFEGVVALTVVGCPLNATSASLAGTFVFNAP